MASTTSFSVCIDKQVKQESEALFKDLGMNLTTAINIFLRQAIQTGGFPFAIKLEQANRETLLALMESERLAQGLGEHYYSDVEEAIRGLEK